MVNRCNAAGVRVYVNVILNHMVGAEHWFPRGTAGAIADPDFGYFPFVPYYPVDFHPRCPLTDFADPVEARVCEFAGSRDLNQTMPSVRNHLTNFLNKLIDAGVAGFRVDSAKHMWPSDLEIIFGNVHNLSPAFGFAEGARPFILQEIVDFGDGISGSEYTPLGTVTEIRFSGAIGKVFRGFDHQLSDLVNWGTDWDFQPSHLGVVFVDNHINQRGLIDPDNVVLNFKHPKLYRMASAFMLAHPYGIVRLMSSYDFHDIHDGPPQNEWDFIVSPIFDSNGQCVHSWVCEHRWPQITNMVVFKNVVGETEMHEWWDNGSNQIAFCRGEAGFIAFNNEDENMSTVLQTCLPAGKYCDVISGGVNASNGQCIGNSVEVAENGEALIEIAVTDTDGVLAIHIGSKSRV